jgi:hypothetical protein
MLEYWNTGKLGLDLRIPEPLSPGRSWIVGLTSTFVMKIKAIISFKNHYSIIPLLQYSMNDAKVQN